MRVRGVFNTQGGGSRRGQTKKKKAAHARADGGERAEHYLQRTAAALAALAEPWAPEGVPAHEGARTAISTISSPSACTLHVSRVRFMENQEP